MLFSRGGEIRRTSGAGERWRKTTLPGAVAPPRWNAEGADAIQLRKARVTAGGMCRKFARYARFILAFRASPPTHPRQGDDFLGKSYTPAPRKAPFAPGANRVAGFSIDAARGRRLPPAGPFLILGECPAR
jgi:hypothetical protein